MNQRDRAGFTSLSRPYWLECFWGCCKRSGRAHRDWHFVYQFLWDYMCNMLHVAHCYMCIPTSTHLTYNNDKPWFTAKLKQPCQTKEDTYRKVDIVLYKQAKYTLEKEIRVGKSNYSDKLRIQFSFSDSASVWKGLKEITNYKTPSPSTVENQQQADNLNEFYCRFEKTPHTRSGHLSTQPLPPLATPLSPTPAIQISEDDVCQVYWKQKRKKAPGPDGVTPACPKSCADQLAPIFTKIFNRSLELCEVPSCFKCSTIIPIPINQG